MPDPVILARRRFTMADQLRFAALSADVNPIHVDPVIARRTQAGSPVVHGLHALLWVLEELAMADPHREPPNGLRADFSSFILLDQDVRVLPGPANDTRSRLLVQADGLAAVAVELHFGVSRTAAPILPAASSRAILHPDRPVELDLSEIEGQRGLVAFGSTPAAMAEAFPAAARWIGSRRLAALAACTRLVGMVCPGLHSIFNRLDLQFIESQDESDLLAFEVTSIDPRFRFVREAVSGGGITGHLVASVRHPAARQDSFANVSNVIAHDRFLGAKALVVGGSRGLGELTAKLLAAGGADVAITYVNGIEDAASVVDEITRGGGTCTAFRFDVGSPSEEAIVQLGRFTSFYYFPTPTIFTPTAEVFSTRKFSEFYGIYVEAFYNFCVLLRSRCPSDIKVFYPSSVAVTERPAGMTAYAMAKAAGEILCVDVSNKFEHVDIVMSRLPRLMTDQTRTLLTAKEEDSTDVMTNILDMMHPPRD